MKKSLIFVGILAIGFANAQEGNVGINTDQPKATLDIQPNATNLVGTTNQGILAPRLSKTRVANIEAPVQGTLVYVLDENSTEYPNSLISAYTGADAKVAKITEKGYYFYNGTEWVKAGANGELWAQRDNNGVTETYLKPAVGDGNNYYFSGKGSTLLLGNVDEPGTHVRFDEVPHYIGINSSRFKKNIVMANGTRRFSMYDYRLFGPDATNGAGKAFTGQGISLSAQPDVTANLYALAGINSSINHLGSGKINYLTGIETFTSMGEIGGTNTPEVTSNIGASFNPRIQKGKAENVTGIWTYPRIYGGEVKNILGSNMLLNTSELLSGVTTVHPTMNYEKVIAFNTEVNNKINTTTKYISGGDFFVRIENGSRTESGRGVISRARFYTGSTTRDYEGLTSYFVGEENATIENLYGIRYRNESHPNFAPTNSYGLYLDNVAGATTNNFAIYSNTGKVRVGDLAQIGAGDRVVYADENGVLKTGVSAAANVKLATANNVECTEANTGTMNFGSVTINGKATEAFGFCMKNSTGEYKWYYIYGGAGITTGSGAFGSNL